MNLISEDYLMHYGVKGMKWGVRHDPEPSGRRIQKMEKRAIKREYKRRVKSGGGKLFKSARLSTGENFNRAQANFEKVVKNDKEYRELSKKAFDAEKKRLLLEKPSYNSKTGEYDDVKYEKIINSKQYKKLDFESQKATDAKDERLLKLSESYVDTIKEANLNDLNITKNREKAKKYLSGKDHSFVSDSNLDYNPDNYYDEWVDKVKFK